MAYVLKGKKGSTIRFVPLKNGIVEKETLSYSSSVTSNSIEDGSNIIDHVNNAAGAFSISGIIIGGDSAINSLKAMRDSCDIITYLGVTRISNLVFTSLKFERSSKNKNGATFYATFKQIKNSALEYVSPRESELMTSQDKGKSSNAQLSKTVNAGTVVVSTQTVSSSSVEKYSSAYKQISSSAPLTRVTGGYSGVGNK